MRNFRIYRIVGNDDDINYTDSINVECKETILAYSAGVPVDEFYLPQAPSINFVAPLNCAQELVEKAKAHQNWSPDEEYICLVNPNNHYDFFFVHKSVAKPNLLKQYLVGERLRFNLGDYLENTHADIQVTRRPVAGGQFYFRINGIEGEVIEGIKDFTDFEKDVSEFDLVEIFKNNEWKYCLVKTLGKFTKRNYGLSLFFKFF